MRFAPSLSLLLAVQILTGCGDAGDPTGPGSDLPLPRIVSHEPPLVSVPVGGQVERFWPFASADLRTPDDPVNLVFAGRADPRNIRNALLALSGARGAPFPPVAPFDCTWSDAIGGLMAGYGHDARWAGGAVQLQCGGYGPVRFHLRLFDLGRYTVANAHFEVVIPGTADHQVLSWELAEQLVTYDLARTGLLGGPPAPTAAITPAPVHRSIPAVIYNGLPAELRTLIGGPAVPAGDVGIANDGHATVLELAGEAPASAPTSRQELTITYGQVIPKPFCAAGPADFLLVQGPVTLVQEVSAAGDYRMTFRAQGELSAVPFDPATGQPVGAPLQARVSERQESWLSGSSHGIKGLIDQALLPEGDPGAGRLRITILVGSGRPAEYDRREQCPAL